MSNHSSLQSLVQAELKQPYVISLITTAIALIALILIATNVVDTGISAGVEAIVLIFSAITLYTIKQKTNLLSSDELTFGSGDTEQSLAQMTEIAQQARFQLTAINSSLATIEFKPDGSILTANDNFLNAMGYRLQEIQGQHHSMFVEADYARSQEYQMFWQQLAAGQFQQAEYMRIAKHGKQIWINATYSPIKDQSGKVIKVIKLATDVTQAKLKAADYSGQIAAISKAQAVIEFNLQGITLNANDNFLQAMDYRLDEIQGKHHSMFVDAQTKNSAQYTEFWQSLANGEYQQAEYKRFGKGGKEIWIQASYNPIFDQNGKVFKVVKFATDITAQKRRNSEVDAQLNAIGKSQAVIEFDTQGKILNANDNFLAAMGYSLKEIQGQHHSLFVKPDYAASQEYKDFWLSLKDGQYQQAEYQRVAKGGKEVWIQASYNPILDLNGVPFKVIKYATDITEQKLKNADYQGQIQSINKSQAVIEFSQDGVILNANDNFLSAMGYQLADIKGQHHRMFVEKTYAASAEYRQFWLGLANGEYQQAEYKRIANGGKEIWIQASYNPIFDLNGRVVKVVKYASDITEQKIKNSDYQGQIEAIGRSQAVIEFETDGTILRANDNFLTAMGYQSQEVVGKHHSMFVAQDFAVSQEYRAFWHSLAQGEYQQKEYKRLAKGGKEVWIQASYNPILDVEGRVIKVVKFASDVTEQKLKNADYRGQINAIGKSQAVIEFNMDGSILTANDNFLAATGYQLSEIQGKHHRMFVNSTEANSPEYQAFWQRLNHGEYEQGEFKRINKAGQEIWIQASYNPIFDLNNKPFKVVKYASDITEQKVRTADFTGQIEAIGKSQAVIEFDLNGIIQTANSNFLAATGYQLAEIQGKHHSLFVEKEYGQSAEYQAFWQQLNKGEFQQGEYKRIGKGGNEIWISASYNPIFDVNGKPYKVVKYATDVTGRVDAITHATQALICLEKGDLNSNIEAEFIPEFEQLKTAINSTLLRFAGTVSNINTAANQVSRGAEEIAQGNLNLSQRTEEQASSLEETASSMEQMTSTVRQNADNANIAKQLASESQQKAVEGGEVVKRAVKSMDEINQSSKKIADIISVIDEIAFQTNLLALNAAVEAARAGEQGRGFAVVAGEVRNLAGRSAEAAKEIKSLIQDSVTKVQDGTALVNESGETLEQLVGSVKRVNEMVSDISAASSEQSAGIEAVNRAIAQMDENTQQNAALVEQASAAGSSMAEQARQMRSLLSFFQTSDASDETQLPWLQNQVSNKPQKRNRTSQPTYRASAKKPQELSFATDDEEWEAF